MAPSAIDPTIQAFISEQDASKAPPGVVLPPKEIRAIVEKTAGYVARNGEAFETRIREKERSNAKFSFLNPQDHYHNFYLWRLDETRAGRATAVAAGRTDGTNAPAEPEKPKGPTEPPEFVFSARMPAISAQDLDILRLTALFVARNGRQWMTTLSQREARNFQFDFLRPNHSFYQYFSRLVDQYTILLNPGGKEERIEELTKNVRNKYHLLETATKRAEWVKFKEEQRQKEDQEKDEERLAYAQIDWHDFVVVETVLFTEADDHADLPPPTSLSDLQHASLESKAMNSLHSSNLRIEEAMPTADDYHSGTYIPGASSNSYNNPFPAEPMYAQVVGYGGDDDVAMEADSDNEDEETARIRERQEARVKANLAKEAAQGGVQGMKIRSDYVPRAAANAANRRGVQMGVCPNCKQNIPLNEMENHMRIELLDPRWKEQRARADAKYSTTNLSTNDVAANLKRLASQRADLFDTNTGAAMTPEEQERNKKKAVNSWDGRAESRETVRMQNMSGFNVQDQITKIHEKASNVVNPAVGPRRG